MAKINLLPWRSELRRLREREFYIMLGGAALAAVLAWLLWGYWNGLRIDDQDGRNKYLSAEIVKLDDKLKEIKSLEAKREKLIQQQKIIEKLQATRSQMVHLFDELVNTIPEGVRLTSMKQAGDVLTLLGVAQANGNVAAYMTSLDKSKWLKGSDLQQTEVKGTDQRNRYEFGLTVKMISPEQAAATAAAQGAAPGIKPDASAPPAASPAPAQNPAPAPTTPAGGKP
ncbi:MAG: fimbrial assembly protein [Gammaproteobacteria bacterium]|nr:MAG: fimbrial assembly protein [Gammaproteobacteria bacterium]